VGSKPTVLVMTPCGHVTDRPRGVWQHGLDPMLLRPALAAIEAAYTPNEVFAHLLAPNVELAAFKATYGNRNGPLPKHRHQRALDLAPPTCRMCDDQPAGCRYCREARTEDVTITGSVL
jgi:hypothetical protein